MVRVFGFSYLILGLLQQSIETNITAKCCEQNFEVQVVNDTLMCRDQYNTRYQVWSNSYNFLNDSDNGECIDSEKEQFFLYKIDSNFSKIPILTSSVFPKCCPLKHQYNQTTHSCLRSENTKEDIIVGEQFVKVGLPQCRMIVDKFFGNQSDARLWANNLTEGSFCLDKDVEDNFVVRECKEGLHICEKKRCFKKCCPDGQSYVGGGTCRDTFVHGLQLNAQGFSPYIEDIDDEYELIYGAGCSKVSLLASNNIQYSIKKHGEFRYYHNYSDQFQEHNYSHTKTYCLEHATKGRLSGYHLFLCYGESTLDEKFSHTLWAKILSCILLSLTMVIYIYLGEVKSSFGKILINYCLAMIFLMVTLTVAHVYRATPGLECKVRGYLLIFFNMSAFAWVNVMSLDIWWTFGTPHRTIGSDQGKKDMKKFLLYFFYGWGMPLCHTLLILFFDLSKILPEPIQPYLGTYKCFLENRNYARTVLFLIPQLIFQIINTVLFIKTITYCIRVKNEINKMNDSARNKENGKFNADKERLVLIVKLAVIMGIIWIFEVSTAFFENMKSYSNFTKSLEIIMDTITCLQGVFIFLIFICKKKTLNSIKNKLGLGARRFSCSTLSVTQSSHVNGHYPMNRRQTTLSLNENKM